MTLSALFAHPQFTTLGIPIILILLGAMSKMIIHGIKREDLFLGVEATLAGVLATLIYIADTVRKMPSEDRETEKVLVNSLISADGYLVLSFALFITLLLVHKSNSDNQHLLRQMLILGVASNGLGFGSFVLFELSIGLTA